VKYVITLTLVGFLVFAWRANDKQPRAAFSAGERQRGVSWVAGPQEVSDDSYYLVLKQHHVNWIVQTPFGWQPRYDEPGLTLRTQGGWWGEMDEGLRVTTQKAREQGIKTLLKPHIWLHKRENGDKWRSDIAMKDEAAWREWFANYRTFILHYATLAEETGIEALCIGTELHQTAKRTEDWLVLIAEIRSLYKGELTYAANWYQEFEDIRFWDRLDYIGIQAYFPVAKKEKPSLEELISGWQPYLKSIESVQRRYGKPVVFTEVGYKNTPDNAIEPWIWPKREFEKLPGGKWRPIPNPDDRVDDRAQADSFEAVFRVFWDRPWFKGMYIWKWYPMTAGPDRADRKTVDFTPQNGPAMETIAGWYAR